MIIYKDLLTGDEMFTDSSKVRLIDDSLYEVECRPVTRKQGEIEIAGFNPSADDGVDGDVGTDETVETGLDLVLNQRLSETGFSKNDYKNYLKTYTKDLQEKWKSLEWTDGQIIEAKSKLTEAVKKILPKIGDLQFFLGESINPDGMVGLLEYRQKEDGSAEVPIMMFFKHGLQEEKV
ncbi:translationally-controlled tumor protein homolog [Oppia nitens]|uniref:translationally-controlled tumor protein homolog n=1 Tax=Oppia nitens TaxID=1686743 RepID=UPI0023DAA0C5|nr:translationally-controlled tumor protein homolog [Oppia nitens]